MELIYRFFPPAEEQLSRQQRPNELPTQDHPKVLRS